LILIVTGVNSVAGGVITNGGTNGGIIAADEAGV